MEWGDWLAERYFHFDGTQLRGSLLESFGGTINAVAIRQ